MKIAICFKALLAIRKTHEIQYGAKQDQMEKIQLLTITVKTCTKNIGKQLNSINTIKRIHAN